MNILGSGIYIPENVISNNYFTEVLGLDTSANWIESKTGIVTRHYAENETLLEMAYHAARKAIDEAQVNSIDSR